MKVNGIELTEDEEKTFKYLLDIGTDLLKEDEAMSTKAEALLKKLRIFS